MYKEERKFKTSSALKNLENENNSAWKNGSSIWIAVQEKDIMKLNRRGNWISKLLFSRLKYGHVYLLNTRFSTSV